jgi:hypothetical protein
MNPKDPKSGTPGSSGTPGGTRSPGGVGTPGGPLSGAGPSGSPRPSGGTIAPGSVRSPLGTSTPGGGRHQGSPIPPGSIRPTNTSIPAVKAPLGTSTPVQAGTPASSPATSTATPGTSSPAPSTASTTDSASPADATGTAASPGPTDNPGGTAATSAKPSTLGASDPFEFLATVDPSAYDLKAQRKSRLPVLVPLGVLAFGVICFFVFRSIRSHNQAKAHAAFMEEFQTLEKQHVNAFWTCLLGSNADPGSFADNLALGQRIEGQFAADPLEYPDKLLNDCVPKLRDAGSQAERLQSPDEYDDALIAYNKTIPGLDRGIREWAERAKSRGAQRDAEKKVTTAANAFHSVAGDAPPEAVAYDRFLRCAIPSFDRLADGQALVENLFNSCKDPLFLDKVFNTCSRVAGSKSEKADARFKSSLKKFGTDDRDIQAWDDCFRKGRKGAKQDDMETFGKAWVDYLQASGKVREIGASFLKKSE